MNDYITQIIEKLANGVSFQEIIREIVEDIVNSLIANEFLIAMGFDRYGRDGDGDYRNGDYTRLLHTEVGDINVQIPRDRMGRFKQHTVPRTRGARATSSRP